MSRERAVGVREAHERSFGQARLQGSDWYGHRRVVVSWRPGSSGPQLCCQGNAIASGRRRTAAVPGRCVLFTVASAVTCGSGLVATIASPLRRRRCWWTRRRGGCSRRHRKSPPVLSAIHAHRRRERRTFGDAAPPVDRSFPRCPSCQWWSSFPRPGRVERWGCCSARGDLQQPSARTAQRVRDTAELTRASAAGRTEPRRRSAVGLLTLDVAGAARPVVPVVVVVLLEDVPVVVVVLVLLLLRPGRAGRRRAPGGGRRRQAGACRWCVVRRRRAGGTGRGGGARRSQIVLALVDAAPLLPEAMVVAPLPLAEPDAVVDVPLPVAGEVSRCHRPCRLDPSAPAAGAGDGLAGAQLCAPVVPELELVSLTGSIRSRQRGRASRATERGA